MKIMIREHPREQWLQSFLLSVFGLQALMTAAVNHVQHKTADVELLINFEPGHSVQCTLKLSS